MIGTLITIFSSILGCITGDILYWKYASDYSKYKIFLNTLKIKHDCFDSNIYPSYRGIYIEDSHFDNVTLYFDSKGKLQNK